MQTGVEKTTRTRWTILYVMLFLAAVWTRSPAAEAKPDLPRYFYYYSLAQCLDEFREREFFEFMHAQAHRERTPRVKFVLGILYEHGLGTERDLPKAARWYREADALGYTFSGLGNEADRALRALENSGKDLSPHAAPTPAEEAAAAGDGQTMLLLAERYYFGLCAPLDWDKAKEWEIRAAEAGSLRARRIVEDSYRQGLNAYPRNPDLIPNWETMPARNGGTASESSVDTDEALGKILREINAAKADLPEAKPEAPAVAKTPVPEDEGKEDTQEGSPKGAVIKQLGMTAEEFIRRSRPVTEYAAEIYREGKLLYDGGSAGPDYFNAGLRFSEATGFGVLEPDNYYLLGLIQENGLCGEANLYAAGKNYRLASEFGHVEAMLRLARLHEKGAGVRVSRQEADRLYRAAAAKGGREAMERLREFTEGAGTGPWVEEWEKSPDFQKMLADARRRAAILH